MPTFPVLGRYMQEDQEFKAVLCYSKVEAPKVKRNAASKPNRQNKQTKNQTEITLAKPPSLETNSIDTRVLSNPGLPQHHP